MPDAEAGFPRLRQSRPHMVPALQAGIPAWPRLAHRRVRRYELFQAACNRARVSILPGGRPPTGEVVEQPGPGQPSARSHAQCEHRGASRKPVKINLAMRCSRNLRIIHAGRQHVHDRPGHVHGCSRYADGAFAVPIIQPGRPEDEHQFAQGPMKFPVTGQHSIKQSFGGQDGASDRGPRPAKFISCAGQMFDATSWAIPSIRNSRRGLLCRLGLLPGRGRAGRRPGRRRVAARHPAGSGPWPGAWYRWSRGCGRRYRPVA